MLLSCSRPDPRADPPAGGAITVTSVQPAVYRPEAGRPEEPALAASCKAWTLTKQQVAEFFAASSEYPDGTRDAFYWLPCSINGQLLAEGRQWEYQINAAATATWASGDRVRTWGCTAKACETLVLMMPDGNAG